MGRYGGWLSCTMLTAGVRFLVEVPPPPPHQLLGLGPPAR